jgi:Zn finger protein HypA/HybF involved in hydrogenase expression
MGQLSDTPKSRSIDIGPWSHEVLRRADDWSIPVTEECPGGIGPQMFHRYGDRSRAFALQLDYFSPERGPGFTLLRLERRDLSRWLYGIKADFPPEMTGNPGLRQQRQTYQKDADRLYRQIAALDWARWDWKNGRSASSRKKARTRIDALLPQLRAAMHLGLERTMGEEVPRSAIYASFVARKIKVSGLAVCECCLIVFETPTGRATRCQTCRTSAPRLKLYPVWEGGWHLSAHLGPPWYRYVEGKPEMRREVTYAGLCTECGQAFEAKTARQRLCRNCGSNAGRVRRNRGASGGSRGRQKFRFAGRQKLLSAVSLQLADSTSMTLTAVAGVIETDDAEVAAQLERNPSLRRLSSDLHEVAAEGTSLLQNS